MSIPQELKNAIWSARRQYAAVQIKETEGFVNEAGLITLIPKSPEADETWEMGGSINFRLSDELSIKAEITSFDPSTGEIYVRGGADLKDLEDLTGILTYYVPFDFAKVLDEAYGRIDSDPRLAEVLALAHVGELDVPGVVRVGVLQADPSLGVIRDIWAKRWALLWGPPGTGKTKCLADALAAYTSIGEQGKIIVLAPTNKATDEIARRICELLRTRGDLRPGALCPVFRGGKGVGKELADSYKECLGDGKYAKVFQDALNSISELEKKRDAARLGGNRNLFHALQSQIKSLRGSLPDETAWVIKDGFAQIIVLTTYKGLTLVGKDHGHIYKVIIDEAGMVSRAVTGALAILGDTVLLAGDPKQIGPIYLQEKGVTRDSSLWMAKSGLSHLEAGSELLAKENVLFLDKQYRMHPHISKVVSHFTYNKLLKDADQVKDLPASSQAFPKVRATPVILNSVTQSSEHLCASKAKKGRGFERDYSAKLAVDLAGEACAGGDSVLVLTPYRAQARLIRRKLEEMRLQKKVGVGTIHKHQGAERDVVILDTVKGCHPWHAVDVKMLLNVSASRAKKHFFMISSMEEVLGNPLLYELATLMGQQEFSVTAYDRHGQGSLFSYTPIEVKRPKALIECIAPTAPADSLGAEINSGIKLVLISQEQSKLIEKPLRDGHYLVRGVAGSGKSLILANWAISALKKNPNIKILITYYNKGLKSLLDCMLSDSRLRYDFNTLQDRITVVNINRIDVKDRDAGAYDIVFVDEAQDFDPGQLESAYLCAKPFQKDGKEERNIVVFHDDSQNIYGRQILEDKLGRRDEFQAHQYIGLRRSPAQSPQVL